MRGGKPALGRLSPEEDVQMGKVVVVNSVTLDGVTQAPGRPWGGPTRTSVAQLQRAAARRHRDDDWRGDRDLPTERAPAA